MNAARSPALHELRRFGLTEYHRLIAHGFFQNDDGVELLAGFLVHRPPITFPLDATVTNLVRQLTPLLRGGQLARHREGLDVLDSRPQPDVSVTRGAVPEEVVLVVEVSDDRLQFDRVDKGRIYARASIPQYWVVNLVDRQIEIYTDPTGPVSVPVYRVRRDFPAGTTVPVELDGVSVGSVSVDEVLP